jgi:hypothetical protein
MNSLPAIVIDAIRLERTPCMGECPVSAYGSRYLSQSATNPYTTTPPVVEYDDLDS